MHYDSLRNDHGLPHDPFKALVTPRPIGWITSIDKEGRLNCAPYSFFNAISDNPHLVMFSSDGVKDSLQNIEETGEFTCSLATFALREAMNVTSAPLPRGVSETERAGLATAPSHFVKPPRIAAAPAALECRLTQIMPVKPLAGEARYTMVIGQVVGIYIDDAFIRDGRVDVAAMLPIARGGYQDYFRCGPQTVFTMMRPVV